MNVRFQILELLFKDLYAGSLRTVSRNDIYMIRTCRLYRNLSTTGVLIILRYAFLNVLLIFRINSEFLHLRIARFAVYRESDMSLIHECRIFYS